MRTLSRRQLLGALGTCGLVPLLSSRASAQTPPKRLVVFYTKDVPEDTVWDALNRSTLPKLWVPKKENVHRVDAIPVLGTGKVDLRRLKQLAIERAGVPAPQV